MQTRRKPLTPFLAGDRPAEDAIAAARPAPPSGARGITLATAVARAPMHATTPAPSATRMTGGAVPGRAL